MYSRERNAQVLIALLKSYNIKHVIASPGSTNQALVGSLQFDEFFTVYSAVDERSAAYMACGMAAELDEPVVLSCTGATASRNYLPGLTEAYYRNLPVIAITSTGDTNRIGNLVPQVIDRTILPNDTYRFSSLIEIMRSGDSQRHVEVVVNKGLSMAKDLGLGPVHFNLETEHNNSSFDVVKLPDVAKIDFVKQDSEFPEIEANQVGIFIGSHKRMDDELVGVIDEFCRSNNAVVFHDHTSGYHGEYGVLSPLLLGQTDWRFDSIRPDLLIHLGSVSGDYYFSRIGVKNVWRIENEVEIRDTFKVLSKVFLCNELEFFRYYSKNSKRKESYYLNCKNKLKSLQDEVVSIELPLSNIFVARAMSSCLPNNSVIHFGILNSLRSWNFFELNKTIHSYCNVGGFGIDGNTSSTIGSALITTEKINYLVTGDLAFFYDLNSLGNRHTPANLRVLLINNGRGTEFTNYTHSAAQFGNDVDRYIAASGHFGSKSKDLVKGFSEALGFEYSSASSKEELKMSLNKFMNPVITAQPMLLEVFTESGDESEALKNLLSLRSDNTVKAKSMAKSLIGQDNISKIKKWIK